MFGYRIIKEVEIENLKDNLAHANVVIADQTKHIAELLNKIGELEKAVADLNESKTVKVESTEEKPVKKVRRKSTKKTTKKEE
jgi:uncharacterized coiled-coil protein SlyX